MAKQFELSYLPLFYEDLYDTLFYIQGKLKSPKAALDLLEETEKAILDRLSNPAGYKPYPSKKQRSVDYYPIYVKNHVVFYVVIDNVMEVRRFLYNKRDMDKLY